MRADVIVMGVLLALGWGPSVAADDPDQDLLIYIGGLVDVNDTWVGPDDMQDVAEPPVEVTRRDDAATKELPE
jgi:hypothetical protein